MPQPTWRDILESEVLTSVPGAAQTTAVQLNAELNGIIRRAAASRNMTAAAYMRRAAVAFAVHDLGLDWEQVMANEPRQATARRPNMGKAAIRAAGHGFGGWRILGLGKHFADD